MNMLIEVRTPLYCQYYGILVLKIKKADILKLNITSERWSLLAPFPGQDW